MTETVKLVIDDKVVLQYDKSIALPSEQFDYIHKMDEKMSSQGITLLNQNIESPDVVQKCQFVLLNILIALDKNNDQQAIIFFTYIVQYQEDLKQVKVKGDSQNYSAEFVFDEIGSDWQTVSFS